MSDLNGKAIELSVRLALVGLLAYWCFSIFRPFLMPLVWAIVLAVALRPAFERIERLTGGRRKIAAVVFALACLALVLVPAIVLSDSMLDGIRAVSSKLEGGDLKIPPAPERVAQWPVVGKPLYEFWNRASTSLDSVTAQFAPQIKAAGLKLILLAKQAAVTVLLTAVAVVIAAFLLIKREVVVKTAHEIGARIAGDAGVEIVKLAGQTIGTVAKGVVGVAAIQAALAGIGLLVAGVPGAGLWALIILVLAVAQLPPLLVLGPAILYLLATDASMTTVVLLSIWSIVVSVSDGLLKPLLLGRGSDTPVLVILIGAIGGLMLHGLIGLFVGAVVLSTGHRLFGRWMRAT